MSALVIVGEGPILTLAMSIARRNWKEEIVRAVELRVEQIGTTDLDFLERDDPASTRVFAAVGRSALNHARFDLWGKMRIKGFRSETLVHPTADIDPTARVGEQCLIGPFVSVGPNAQVERGAVLLGRNSIAVDTHVGSFVWMGTNASVGMGGVVGSHVVLGEDVSVADGVVVGSSCEISVPGTYRRPLSAGTFIVSEFEAPARMVGLA